MKQAENKEEEEDKPGNKLIKDTNGEYNQQFSISVLGDDDGSGQCWLRCFVLVSFIIIPK